MTRQKTWGNIGQLLVELGPALTFMVSYNVARRYDEAEAIFWATGLFMAATVIALAVGLLAQRRLPLLLIVSGAIVLVFGALTLWLHNALFAYLKPTIINGLFAAAIIGGQLLRRNVWKLMFRSVFTLPDRIWDILAWRWAAYYAVMAALNLVVLQMFGEAVWANFRVVGVMGLTALFLLANLPITLKWAGKETMQDTAADR